MSRALTVAQAAELTGLHKQTIRERIRNGDLAAVKASGPHGPEWRIERPDALALIGDREGARHPESDSPSDSGSRLEEEVAALQAALSECYILIEQLQRDLRQVREELVTATGATRAMQEGAGERERVRKAFMHQLEQVVPTGGDRDQRLMLLFDESWGTAHPHGSVVTLQAAGVAAQWVVGERGTGRQLSWSQITGYIRTVVRRLAQEEALTVGLHDDDEHLFIRLFGPCPRGQHWMQEQTWRQELAEFRKDREMWLYDHCAKGYEEALRKQAEVLGLWDEGLIERVRERILSEGYGGERDEDEAASVSTPDPIPDAVKAHDEPSGLTTRCVALLAPMTGGRSSAAAERAVMNAAQVHPLAHDVLLETCAALVARWEEEGDRVKLSFLANNVGRAARWLERDQSRERGATHRLPPSTAAEDATEPLAEAVASALPPALCGRWLDALRRAISGPDRIRDEAEAIQLLQKHPPLQTEVNLPAKWFERVMPQPARGYSGGMMPVSDWEAKRREAATPKPGISGTGWHLLDQILGEDEVQAGAVSGADTLLSLDPADDPFGDQ